eukprot:Nk52_evm19s745 gene=Nk52_evmTU19s745
MGNPRLRDGLLGGTGTDSESSRESTPLLRNYGSTESVNSNAGIGSSSGSSSWRSGRSSPASFFGRETSIGAESSAKVPALSLEQKKGSNRNSLYIKTLYPDGRSGFTSAPIRLSRKSCFNKDTVSTMKFGHYLTQHQVPEWRDKYVAYKMLKKKIKRMCNEKLDVTDISFEHKTEVLKNEFRDCIETELFKVNGFFEIKMKEANEQLQILRDQLLKFREITGSSRESTSESVVTEEVEVRCKSDPRGDDGLDIIDFPSNIWAKDGDAGNGIRNRKVTLKKNTPKMKSSSPEMSSSSIRKSRGKLKDALAEYYRGLDLLRNYQILNFTALVKFIKKFQKATCGMIDCSGYVEAVSEEPFNCEGDIKRLMTLCENMMCNEFYHGDRKKGMKNLRLPSGHHSYHWASFRLGLYMGIIFTALLITILLNYEWYDPTLYSDWNAALLMFRGTCLPIFMFFLFGIDVFIWKLKGVNHVFIFELDPRNNLSYLEIMEFAGVLMLGWIFAVLLYVTKSVLHINGIYSALGFALLLLVFLINPLPILHRSGRFYLLRVAKRMVLAPFYDVLFADFWLGDQMNSLNITLLDWYFTGCYFVTGLDDSSDSMCLSGKYGIRPILTILPAMWRFLQCLRRYRDTGDAFPHLANAGKYSTAFFVCAMASLDAYVAGDSKTWTVFRYFWILASIVSTIYTSTWDITMDWGLARKREDGKRYFLRKTYLYPEWFYYGCATLDVGFRWLWTLTIAPGQTGLFGAVNHNVLLTILAFCEIVRRFVWNMIRLENEHLNNCGKFRAVRSVPLPFGE